jgi:hypothetical protein
MDDSSTSWRFRGTLAPGSPTRWEVNPAESTTIILPGKLDRIPLGESLQIPLLPEVYCGPVGAVVAYWGEFEIRMDRLLEALVFADNDPDDAGWRRLAFERRRKLLKRKIKARFPGPLADKVVAILGAARIYHWQRNLIVHGHYRLQIEDGRFYPVAQGYVGDEYLELPLNEDFLMRMYHELGMLSSRLRRLTDEEPPQPSPDISILQEFSRKARLNAPTPRTVPAQHPASLG